jgi:NAD(P)-dependent dehydrogenase (short-subunit alcohol dehydrogenase family)
MSTRIAIVAGAGSGLGQATALALHAARYTVVAVDRSESGLSELPDAITHRQVIATAKNKALFPPEALAGAVEPEAIANVIAFLISDAAAPISGAIIPTYG